MSVQFNPFNANMNLQSGGLKGVGGFTGSEGTRKVGGEQESGQNQGLQQALGALDRRDRPPSIDGHETLGKQFVMSM